MQYYDDKSVDDALNQAKLRGKRVRQLRLLSGFSTRQTFEDRFDISCNTLSSWEDGKKGGLTHKGALRLVYAMKEIGITCTRDWLLHGVGLHPQASLLPINVDSSEYEPVYDTDEETAIRNELLTFRRYNLNATDFRVTDNGMEPLFSVGDYVCGQKQFGKNITKCVGLDCIIELDTDEIYLRRIKTGGKPDMYTFYCINPHADVQKHIIENTKIKSAAPVIWHRKKNRL